MFWNNNIDLKKSEKYIKMKLKLLVFLPVWFACAGAYTSQCAKHILKPEIEITDNECMFSSDSQIQLMDNHISKGSHQILNQDLQENLINKAVPKCLIVNYGSAVSNAKVTNLVSTMSRVRALSKCLIVPLTPDLEVLKTTLEGRFHNLDIFLLPLRNATNKEVMWKRSFEQKFHGDVKKLEHNVVNKLVISHGTLSPFYFPSNNGKVVGVDPSAWRIISKHLNLTINFLRAPSMGGSVKMVRQGQAHVAGIQLIMNHDWFTENDLTPSMFQRDIFLHGKYPELTSSYKTLLTPLNVSVWISILTTVIFSALSLAILNKSVQRSRAGGMFDITAPSYSMLISRSMPSRVLYANMSTPNKTLLVFLIPLTTLLSFAYRSNLLASLVKQEYEKPVDTYQDIIDRDITIYYLKGTIVPSLLANSPKPEVVQAYHHNMIAKGGGYTFENGETPDRVENDLNSGKGVEVGTEVRRLYYVRRGRQLDVGSFNCGYYFTMGHPLASKINQVIHILADSGIYDRILDGYVWIRRKRLREVTRTRAIEEENWKKLGNGHVLPMYLLHAVLLCLSCIVFIFNFAACNSDRSLRLKSKVFLAPKLFTQRGISKIPKIRNVQEAGNFPKP